ASYYIKVLDEHLPLAIDILSDIVRNPAFSPDDIEREKKVVVEEIKMVEDTPDDLVHEPFTQGFWENHPLGRPILGTRETVESFNATSLRKYFRSAYTARNLIVSAVGNLEHQHVLDLVAEKFGTLSAPSEEVSEDAPRVVPKILIRNKELEQSHLCLGASSYPQNHDDRYSSYVLNTLLGGSMSSRLFQNVREKRGLAYAVFSGLSAYRDAGTFTVYAGCANEAVGEVLDLIVEELRGVKQTPVPHAELQRSKDHLKGSLMLSLENTASRMSHLARQEIYFDRQLGLDETLAGIERAAAEAMAAAGTGPIEAARDIRERGAFDIARIDEIEQTTQHDVIAFTTAVAEHVGPSARWLHFGMTSSDVIDTAQALQMREACDLILKDLRSLAHAVRDRALEHRHTPIIGRTHGVHAEPMTFGLKLALWFAEIGRD